jgi:hypothetical protein
LNHQIQTLLARWAEPGLTLGKGKLVDDSGCMCAMGDALHHCGGWGVQKLRNASQDAADKAAAELLGISITHAVLLRYVNDWGGSPSDVFARPERVLGNEAQIVLAFWRHVDAMTAGQWAARADEWRVARVAARAAARDAAGVAARDVARAAARDAAGVAARDVARAAARDAAGVAARDVAGAAALDAAGATWEIQGATLLKERAQSFYFLPMFGFDSPEAVLAKEAKL